MNFDAIRLIFNLQVTMFQFVKSATGAFLVSSYRTDGEGYADYSMKG